MIKAGIKNIIGLQKTSKPPTEALHRGVRATPGKATIAGNEIRCKYTKLDAIYETVLNNGRK